MQRERNYFLFYIRLIFCVKIPWAPNLFIYLFSSVNMTVNQGASSEAMESIGRPPIWCRSRSPKPGFSTSQPLQADMDRGRTIGNGLLQACLLLLKI